MDVESVTSERKFEDLAKKVESALDVYVLMASLLPILANIENCHGISTSAQLLLHKRRLNRPTTDWRWVIADFKDSDRSSHSKTPLRDDQRTARPTSSNEYSAQRQPV